MDRPNRKLGEPLSSYEHRRAEYIRFLRSRKHGPLSPAVVERVTEVVREVPVDRVVTKYVTDPATLARLAELEAALAAKKADIDERISMPRLDTKTMPEAVRVLIQSESKTVDELIQEYADLTNLIMQGLATEAQRARQQKLHSIVQWSQSQNA